MIAPIEETNTLNNGGNMQHNWSKARHNSILVA